MTTAKTTTVRGEVHDRLPPEGLAKSATLVVPGEKQVEEGYLELEAMSNADGGG